jgi:hypothetical protein
MGGAVCHSTASQIPRILFFGVEDFSPDIRPLQFGNDMSRSTANVASLPYHNDKKQASISCGVQIRNMLTSS